MSKPACKCKEVECEDCPEWIFTLADLIMCMMGLFVILWVLKPDPGKTAHDLPTNDDQLVKVLASIRDYFEFVPDSTNPDKVDIYRLLKKLESMKPLRGPGDGGKTTLERKGAAGDQPEVLSVRKGPQAIVGSRVLFDVGSERLTPQATKILDQIVLLIKGHRNVMLVKGHTAADDLPENAEPQQKLNLSIRRAQVVADYLVSRGVEPDILRVIGCSTFEPVMQRAYTIDNRQLNRRVELEATTTLVTEFQGTSATSRPSDTRPSAATRAATTR